MELCGWLLLQECGPNLRCMLIAAPTTLLVSYEDTNILNRKVRKDDAKVAEKGHYQLCMVPSSLRLMGKYAR